MKFSNLAKGNRALKPVKFRLGNAPLPTSPLEATDPIPEDEYTARLALKVLTPEETAGVYEKAGKLAREKGVEQWLDTHPICRLYEMACTLFAACVDVEAGEKCEPFFASVDEIVNSPSLGSDNIAHLWEQYTIWQDECSLKVKNFSLEEIIATLYIESEREENAESPLARMRPSMLASFMRTTAKLWLNSLVGSLHSISTASSGSTSEPKNSGKSEYIEPPVLTAAGKLAKKKPSKKKKATKGRR
jgi:hypothetical protein